MDLIYGLFKFAVFIILVWISFTLLKVPLHELEWWRPIGGLLVLGAAAAIFES